jgi:uncharacterized protein
MPTTYRTPGVYVEWLDANPQRLELGRSDVAGFVGVAERGPVQAPVKIESNRQFLTTFGERVPYAYLAYAVAGFFENGGRTCWVVRAADPERAGPARARLLIDGRACALEAGSPGAWGDRITVEAVWGRDRITHLVATAPDGRTQTLALEAFEEFDEPVAGAIRAGRNNLLGIPDTDLPELTPDLLVRVVPDNPLLPTQVLGQGARIARLSGGVNGLSTITPHHFTGNPDREATWGVAALERVDDVSFVSLPDLMAGQDALGPEPAFQPFSTEQLREAQIDVITSCLRARDRIAILDAPPVSRNQAIRYKSDWPASSFGALYHPWIAVDDPLRLRSAARFIPPSGHVAGMVARVDRLRGVHKPPANETLEGVFDVRELLDDEAHGDLNEAGINAIRAVPGRGVLVLGARTLDSDIRWRYVNVRRLFTTIEETLDEQMQWLTFEPNSPRLWREVERAVTGFLERLFRAGMLDGRNPEEAYFARCDASTNPEPELDEGRVICVLGIQPPYPAEFVVVRIGVTRSGIQVEEKGAQDV